MLLAEKVGSAGGGSVVRAVVVVVVSVGGVRGGAGVSGRGGGVRHVPPAG